MLGADGLKCCLLPRKEQLREGQVPRCFTPGRCLRGKLGNRVPIKAEWEPVQKTYRATAIAAAVKISSPAMVVAALASAAWSNWI